jgi:ureidoglycolate hydrolase
MPAAPNIEGANEPDLSKLVALRVRRGEGVVFARGVWHGVPFTLKEESFAVVGFSLDTAQNDMYFRDLDPRVTILA